MFGEFADLKKFKTSLTDAGLEGTILLNTYTVIKNMSISLMEEYPKRAGIYLAFMEAYPTLYMGTKEKLYKAAQEAGNKDFKSILKHMAESYAQTVGPKLMDGFVKGESYPIARLTKGVTKDPSLIVAIVSGNDVPSYAFDGCVNLRFVILLDSVKNVGANAFAGCTNLKTVYANAETVISDSAFASDVKIKTVGASAISATPTEADVEKYIHDHPELIPAAQPTEVEVDNSLANFLKELGFQSEEEAKASYSVLNELHEAMDLTSSASKQLSNAAQDIKDAVKSNNLRASEIYSNLVAAAHLLNIEDIPDKRNNALAACDSLAQAIAHAEVPTKVDESGEQAKSLLQKVIFIILGEKVSESDYDEALLSRISAHKDEIADVILALRRVAVSAGLNVSGTSTLTDCKRLSTDIEKYVDATRDKLDTLTDGLVPVAVTLNSTLIKSGGEPVSVTRDNIVDSLRYLSEELSNIETKSVTVTSNSVDEAIEVLKQAVKERKVNPSKIRELTQLTQEMSKELTPKETALKTMAANNVPPEEYDKLSQEVADETPDVVKRNFPGTFEELVTSGIRSRFEQTARTKTGVSLADVYSEIRVKYQCEPGDINHIYHTLAQECGYDDNSPNTDDKMLAVLNKLKEE